MDLKDIYISSQPFDASVNGVKDLFSAETNPIHHDAVVGDTLRQGELAAICAQAEVRFGKNDNIFARDVVLLNCSANNSFALSMGINICLRVAISTCGVQMS